MFRRSVGLLAVILFLSPVTGCGEAEPSQDSSPTKVSIATEPPINATSSPPATTSAPLPTAASEQVPPTSPAETDVVPTAPGGLTIQVPAGVPASLDGVLDADEWVGAYEDKLSDGGELYLMQEGGYLYVGIRAIGAGSGVGSVCVNRGDEVTILHSSAALGTAVYERGGGGWEQTQGFSWRCRSTSDSPSAREERGQFLQEEGWLANNGRMGTPGVVEYRIAMPEGSLRLAVSYIGPPDFEAVSHWPADLADDCAEALMLQGPIPEQAQFAPEEWAMVGPAGDPEAVPPGTLGDTRTRSADGMVMVYVPGGTFPMGSSTAQIEDATALCEEYPDEYGKCKSPGFGVEAPEHSVTLDGFWLDRTEVTNTHYRLCVADGACRESRLANDLAYGGDDYPAAGIPWQDAQDYCVWAGGRLPTEAEWEYAARGSEGYTYPWGEEFTCTGGNFWDKASGCDDGFAEPAPVGSFPEGTSWCGALDMAGNVWEWVADVYGPYPDEGQANPTGPASGGERVLRGGSWGYHQPFVRAAYRYPVPPAADYLAVGFRCAASEGE